MKIMKTIKLFIAILLIVNTVYAQKTFEPIKDNFQSPFGKNNKAKETKSNTGNAAPQKDIKIETVKGSFSFDVSKYNLTQQQIEDNLCSYLSLNNKNKLIKISQREDDLGFTHINYQQQFNNIPVDGALVMLHLKNGKPNSINGQIATIENLATTATINAEQALQIAKDYAKAKALLNTYPTQLLIAQIPTENGFTQKLSYKVRIDASFSKMENVFVDAITGKVLNVISLINDADVTATANTLYSGTQTIKTDSYAGGYRLRDSARKIETYDATNATGSPNYIGYSDYQNTNTTWIGVPKLNSFTISSVAQNWWYTSIIDETPDLYIIVKNSLNQIVYKSSYVSNTNPPVTFSNINIVLTSPPYTLEVWDYDPTGDDFGGSYTISSNTGLQYWVGNGNNGNYIIGASNNPALDVHWGMEKTYDFYKSVFGRNSYDGLGSVIKNFINPPDLQAGSYYGTNNAFANANNVMCYGLGDGIQMKAVVSLDVEGHEFTHMVVANNGYGGLYYQGESGALNESFADIFGTCIEFYTKPATANWTIGEDLYLVAPYYFRSLSNPNSANNPDTYKGTYWINTSSSQDNGGVHYNSGVQNYWFYLLSQGGSGTNDLGNSFTVTGIGINQARQIAYKNLTTYIGGSYATYLDAYNGSLLAAEQLFGNPSTQYSAVRQAWYAVGIGNDPNNYCSGTTRLTSTSGTITDGSGAANYKNNANCKWVIAPPGANTITINFANFSTESNYDTVIVYNGPDESYPALLKWWGNTLPPTKTTSGGALTIRFVSDNSSTAAGWSANYTSSGIIPGCNGGNLLTTPTGNFGDGSGAINYGNNQFCYWNIAPPCATSVTLNFTQLDTEDGFDFVSVYDGVTSALLGTFSGSTLPSAITSTSGNMVVLFESDYLYNYQGFTANYTSTGSSYCSGTTVLNTSDYGFISDGSGTNKYCNNSNCSWLIQPPQANSVSLRFTNFNVEAASTDGQSIYDAVEVYDGTSASGTLLGRFAGNAIPPVVTANSGSMFVKFFSDLSVNDSGWSAIYTSTSPSYCNATTALTSPSGTITDGSGTDKYANNSNCSWLIQPSCAKNITLNFTAFNTELNYDGVIVYDGKNDSATVLRVITGPTIPSFITSTGGSMYIKFISDEILRLDGFTANYTSNVLTPTSNTTNLSGCNSVTYKTKVYTASTVIRDTVKSYQGCDSIYNVANITVRNLAPTTNTINLSGCNSVTYKTKVYTASTIVRDTVKTAQDCDSIYNVANITVRNLTPATNTQNLFGCSSVTYKTIVYTASTIIKDTVRTTQGCDSIYNVANIIVRNLVPTTNTQNLFGCSSVTYKTIVYTASIIIKDTVRTTQGCDSIYNVVNITIYKPTSSTQSLSICPSQLPYSWNGLTFTAAGSKTKTGLTNNQGCDSSATLNLTVSATPLTNALNFSGCQQVIYKGKTYLSSSTFIDTAKNSLGCDSIYYTVYITVRNTTPVTQTQNLSGCKKLFFNGITYTTDTTLRDTLFSSFNCDSIYKITNITINTNCVYYVNTRFTVSMTNYLRTGNTIDTGGIRIAGNFEDLGINLPNWTPTSPLCKLTKIGSTDDWSILIPIPDTSINKTLLFKFVNTNWGKNEGIDFGSELRNSSLCSVVDGGGNYNRFLVLPTNDSSVYYCWERCSLCNTTENAPTVATGTITATTPNKVTVSNNNLIATGGLTVTQKGLLVSTHPNPNIYNNTFNSYFHYINPSLGTYNVFIGGLYSNTQYYARAYASNAIGTTYGSIIPFVLCDTAKRDTLNLTGCGNVIFNGNTYESSTIKRDTLKTTLGCDSIYRVANITVKPTSASYNSATICANALPYTWNGNNYNAAGNYTAHFTNAIGCDSTANLKLIVNALPVISLTSASNCVNNAKLSLTGASNALQIIWQNSGATVNTTTPSAAAFGITVAGGNPTSTLPNALNGPSSVFVDKTGVLYVGDLNNARIQRFAVGNLNATTVAGGYGIGVGLNQINSPSGVMVNDSNNVYVGDFGNHRVTKWLPNATSGIVVAGGNGSTNTSNAFNGVADIFIDAANNIYIADQNNHRIQKWTPGATSGVTVAGGNGAGAANNQINLPTAVFVDAAGNVYVGDYGNKRVTKWAVGATSGVTVAGGNGAGAANNQIDLLAGLYVDAIGNVYVADQNNHRIQKWTVGATSGVTVAGGNGAGSNVNQFKYPKDIYIDTAGAMYVPDNWNQRVQKWLQTINTSYTPTIAGVYTAIVTNNSGCIATSNAIIIGASATPTNSIIASATSICDGEKVNFTATANNGGSLPQFQWFKNNVTVGANANIYSDSLLHNNDSVWCLLTSNSTCATIATAKSNVILMQVSSTIRGNIKHPTKGNIVTVNAKLIGTINNTLSASGSYAFNCLPPSTVGVIKLSKNNDINKANGVNATDVLFTQRHILNTAKLNSAYKLIAADVNGDKLINATDVLRIKRLILGTDTTFTKGSGTTKVDRLWEFVDSAYQFPDTTNPFPFKDSISFSNLTSNKINQTFIGVKLGDVNYDWNPAVARQFTVNSLQLNYSNSYKEWGMGNSVVRIPITVMNFKELVAMQYTLHFNSKDYEFIGIENNKIDIDFNSKQANQNGNISMLWTDKNAIERSLEDGTEILVLVLKQKGTRNLELGISDAITDIAAWDKDYNQHNIVLSQKEKVKTQNLDEYFVVSPNPTSGEIKVSLLSKVKKTVSFELTDAQGKAIFKQVVALQKGNNNFTMNLKQNGNITTGIYFLKAVGLEGENVKRMMVINK